VLLGLDRAFALPTPHPQLAVQDALYNLLFNGVFVALALATRRAARRLDAAADEAADDLRASAAAAARRAERSRVDALLHDNVLVALLASSRGSAQAAAQARSALAELGLAHSDPATASDFDATEWLWRVQALVTELAPDARFSHEETPSAVRLPSDAGRALLEATAEAVRNSIRHAGDASRAVHVRLAADAAEVTVLDDGAGFDPDDLPPGRLGIAVSIRERMRNIPGGRAAVVARPGVGTRVSLAWRRAA